MPDTTPLPIAILFDLDDTLISSHLHPRDAWKRAIVALDEQPVGLDADDAATALHQAARWFWSDPARHKEGRLNIRIARRHILRRAFTSMGRSANDPVIDPLGDRFTELRTAETRLFPDAIETLVALKQRNIRLGLITNGNAQEQRAKINRFALEDYFEHIQIEGEVGFGKPEEQAYAHALSGRGTAVEDTWITGTTSSGKSWFRSVWAFMRSGATRSATACPRARPPNRTASSSD